MDPWDALSADQRKPRHQALAQRVRALLEESVGTYYADRDDDVPEITVFASEQVDAGMQLRFVADHYVYNHAWSGSDWADHYFGLGEAVLKNAKVVSLLFSRTRSVALTELQADDYDGSQIRTLVVAEAVAKYRGLPFDETSIEVAISMMKGTRQARLEAVAGGHAAEATVPSPPAPPVSTCPNCGSTDAGLYDVIFEIRRMRCNACGFSEDLTWMDDDNW